jgi:hypothetical protein
MIHGMKQLVDSWEVQCWAFDVSATLEFSTTTNRKTDRTLPATIGMGCLASVIVGVFEVTGGTLRGFTRDPDVDEFERKQQLRENRRRPVQETIHELGEGRGIYAPGYAERRKERIKQAYGIDVPS